MKKITFIIAILSLLINTSSLATASVLDNEIPSSGSGWSGMKTKVDKHVRDMIKENNLPGMTVAVTKDGRLIYSMGYGYSKKGSKAVVMNRDTRIRIGSLTKAAITGPAAWQLMKDKGINPQTQTLYGPNGIFGNAFENEINTGVKRHTPIIDIGINSENRVYAWYSNGTVSSGTTADLDSHSAPTKFSLPDGMKPVQIRAIAISKNDRVHVWYEDGTHSVGTTTDLDRYIGRDSDNDPKTKNKVRIPDQRKMADIVGIGISKSSNRIYVWYEDGMVSSGSTTNFGEDFPPKPFRVAHGSGGTSYNIRGMDISANDNVYAWFINGKVSSGTPIQLDSNKAPYPYSYAAFGATRNDMKSWYYKITIQDLLDHKSGFMAASTPMATKLHKTNKAMITYEQIHRHFLMSRKLMSEPGTAYDYQNHNFGIWNIIFPKISPFTYREYAKQRYLRPLGLLNDVVPAKANDDLDNRDAWGHSYNSNGNPVVVKLEKSEDGLAAGGFTAAAEDIAKIMVNLQNKYTWTDINKMGWGGSDSGRLSHSGKTPGGTSYAAMFKEGQKSSADKKDLSRINVVVITNIWACNSNDDDDENCTADLKRLANKIVLEVPDSNLSNSYDIWKSKPVNPK